MVADAWKPGWRDVALEWALKLLLAPLWVPAIVLGWLELNSKTRPLVRGRIEDAWERCAAVWRECGLVCQWTAHDGAAFGHELATALAHRHRGQKGFFLARLRDPDPLLAAYAFKCLIRVYTPTRADLPAGTLERSELVRVLWADLVDEEALGSYFEGWFQEREALAQQGHIHTVLHDPKLTKS